MLIVNQLRSAEQRRVGPGARRFVSRSPRRADRARADPSRSTRASRAAVEQRQPAIQAFPLCRFSRSDRCARAVACSATQADVPRELASRSLPEKLADAALAAARAAAGRSGRSPAPTCAAAASARPLHRRDDRAHADPRPRPARERALRSPADRQPYLESYVIAYARELGVHEFAALADSYLANPRPSR